MKYLKFGLLLPVVALLGCGSHPKYYGECHVYVGPGKDYRATIDLYGSPKANSRDGHIRLAQLCKIGHD